MKIAYVCQSYPPMMSGAALVVQRLAEGISAVGHSVIVITAGDHNCANNIGGNGLQPVRLKSFPNPLRVDQSFVLWSQDKIFRTLKKFRPDILHIHDPLNLGISAIRAAQRVNIPSILTIHQLPWFITTYLPGSPRVKNILESSIWQYSKWLFKQCDALITPSRMIADIVWTHSRFQPQVISNGVDLDLFSPKLTYPDEAQELCEKYDLCPNTPVILYVGRIDPDKRVDLVIRAATKVMHSTDAQLFVVGDGTQRHDLIQLSQSLGIHQNCRFPGFIPKNKGLPGIYRLASVFVTASEIEIQSSVVLEACASGLPVITVRASSMPELIRENESGFLVSPGDLDTLADRLVSLVKDLPKAKKMGGKGRLFAEQHSNQRFIQEHERYYAAVLQIADKPLIDKVMA